MIVLDLTEADLVALRQLIDEVFPGKSESAVALKLVRDELIRCGVMEPGKKNRSRGARNIR